MSSHRVKLRQNKVGLQHLFVVFAIISLDTDGNWRAKGALKKPLHEVIKAIKIQRLAF